ncbi:MAG: hypothetical protein JRI23_10265 [Deltaproteobacteria bacterium]|nr:hypothetical protein [Deltaproteobacteria bacterium]MBW2532052.1 hypothetical protein [Deltaproteobacteria bacterium]
MAFSIESVTDPDERLRETSQYLAEIEEGRLPKPAVDALSAAADRSVDVRRRADIAYRVVTETVELRNAWNHACDPGRFGDGARVLAMLSAKSLTDRDKTAQLFGRCRLSRRGLVAKPEQLTQARDMMVLAHAIHAFLEQRGGIADFEQRLLGLLATSGPPWARPIAAAELQPVDEPPVVTVADAAALRKRVAEGVALLEAGDLVGFIEKLAHPKRRKQMEEGGGIEQVAAQMKGSAAVARMLAAFKWARDHDAVNDGKGRARFLLPHITERDAIEELVFKQHEGIWYFDR